MGYITNRSKQHTFHDAATAAANGTPLIVEGFRTLAIEISGTSSAQEIEFTATGPSGTQYPITGVKMADLSTAQSTTGTGELWQFDITGLQTVIMDLTSVTGGNITVKGKAVG